MKSSKGVSFEDCLGDGESRIWLMKLVSLKPMDRRLAEGKYNCRHGCRSLDDVYRRSAPGSMTRWANCASDIR